MSVLRTGLIGLGMMGRHHARVMRSIEGTELVAVAGRLNNAFRRLGSGWAIFVEAQRQEASTYPASQFPDAAAALLDAERKADFEEAGAHYVSSYFLTITYLPPAEDADRKSTRLNSSH